MFFASSCLEVKRLTNRVNGRLISFQPSVAPVSRNYNEMRERLRQLLTKKKAKKCKAAGCSPPKSPSGSSPPNANSEAKAATNSVARSNTPISTASTVQQDQRDQRNLEELLEFIEGNQNSKKDNNKKAEKKARQKQRKVCLCKL